MALALTFSRFQRQDKSLAPISEITKVSLEISSLFPIHTQVAFADTTICHTTNLTITGFQIKKGSKLLNLHKLVFKARAESRKSTQLAKFSSCTYMADNRTRMTGRELILISEDAFQLKKDWYQATKHHQNEMAYMMNLIQELNDNPII